MRAAVRPEIVAARRRVLLVAAVAALPVLLFGAADLKDTETRMTAQCRAGPVDVDLPDGDHLDLPAISWPCRPESVDVPAPWRWTAFAIAVGAVAAGVAIAWASMPWLSDIDRRTRQVRPGRVRIRPMLGFRVFGWSMAVLGAVVAYGVGTDPVVESTLLKAGCAVLAIGSVALAVRMTRWGIVADGVAVTERRLLRRRRITWDPTTEAVVAPVVGSRVFGGLGIHVQVGTRDVALRSVWRWDTPWSVLLLERWVEQLRALQPAAQARPPSGP